MIGHPDMHTKRKTVKFIPASNMSYSLADIPASNSSLSSYE
jgi:hypothetical protein